MKTYEEMASDALGRIGAYKEKQKKRRSMAMKIGCGAVCCCLVALLGVAAVKLVRQENAVYDKETPSVVMNDTTDKITASAQTDVPVPESDSVSGPVLTPTDVDPRTGREIVGEANDVCHFWWKQKIVMDGSLYWVIDTDPAAQYTVRALFRPTNNVFSDFVYNGKTLGEWADEAYADPHSDGQFVPEPAKLEAYEIALCAYMDSVIPSYVETLRANGIECERLDTACNVILLTVTPEQLENLPLPELPYWVFSLETAE